MRENSLEFVYPRDLLVFVSSRMGLDSGDVRIVTDNARDVTLMRYTGEYLVPDWSARARRDSLGHWSFQTEAY